MRTKYGRKGVEELRGVELSYLFIDGLDCLVCGGTATAADVAILRHPPPEGWENCAGCGDSVRIFAEKRSAGSVMGFPL